MRKNMERTVKRQTIVDSYLKMTEMFSASNSRRRYDINWPPRSPDMTPMYFFLWEYFK